MPQAKSSNGVHVHAQPAKSPRKRKLGERIAAAIIADIIKHGWKEGETLGTERELLARHAVSRATLREAIRQVERHGAAIMRRGAGGGLIVAAPPRNAAVRAMITYLEFSRISFYEQHEVREQLELTAARLASERITADGADDLMALIADLENTQDVAANVIGNMKVRVAVAQATGNPALPLFIETLNGVLRDILAVMQVDRQGFFRDRDLSVRFKRDLVEAIIARDSVRAEQLVQHDTERRIHAMTSMRAGPRTDKIIDYTVQLPGWFDSLDAPLKLSEKIAFQIVADIAQMGWREGVNLGTEAHLQQHYSVSRAVLREALRQLELHGIAYVKSGIQGGVIIGRVDPDYTVELVKTYLHYSRIGMIHLWETQSSLEIFAATQLAKTATPEDIAALDKLVAGMENVPLTHFLRTATALHEEIAERTGNRALSLFIRILLSYGLEELPAIDPTRIPWLLKIHQDIVEAIRSHDVEAARKKVTQLFELSKRWVNGEI